MFRVEDAELILPSSINDLRSIDRRLVLYLLTEGVLNRRIVALYKMTLAELDCQARFA